MRRIATYRNFDIDCLATLLCFPSRLCRVIIFNSEVLCQNVDLQSLVPCVQCRDQQFLYILRLLSPHELSVFQIGLQSPKLSFFSS